MAQGQLQAHGGAAPGPALDPAAAAEETGPLPHAGEAKTAAGGDVHALNPQVGMICIAHNQTAIAARANMPGIEIGDRADEEDRL